MTSDKKRKHQVRARMAETGEPYSEAARHVEHDSDPAPALSVVKIEFTGPPGGWQGHEFAYESVNDLFRCVNCGLYEVSATNTDKTLKPCQPSPEWIAEQEREKAAARKRAAAYRPRCYHTEPSYATFFDDGWEPGDYYACTLAADHDGPHQLAVRNEYDG